MIDELKAVAGMNRIGELQDQIWEELNTLIDTMKSEHSNSVYTREELLLLYAQAIASNLTDRASQHVTAVRIQQAFLMDLQQAAMGGARRKDNNNDTTGKAGAHSESGEAEE